MSNQEIYEELKGIGVLKDKSFDKFQEDMKNESYKSKVQDVLGVDLQKKKDSTFTSPEESTESTIEEDKSLTLSESSPAQETEEIEEASAEVDQSTEDDSEPKTPPPSTPEVDNAWKIKYKEITGLDPDEEGVTYEQAKEGFIPKNPTSVKFRNQGFQTGSITWESQSLGQKIKNKRYAKKYGVENLFGKNGIYWAKGYNDAKVSLELEMPEFQKQKEVVEAEVIDSSTMLDEVEVTAVSLEEATQPTDFEKLDDDSKDLVVSNITTSNPDLDPEKIEVVSVEKYTQERKPVEVADELVDEVDVVSGEQKTKSEKIQELEEEIQKIEEDNKAAEELPPNLEDQKKSTLETNQILKEEKQKELEVLKKDVSRQKTTSEYKAKIIYDGEEMEVNAGTSTTLPEFEVVAPSKEKEKVFKKQKEQFEESQLNILADEVSSKIIKYSKGEESDLPGNVKSKIKEIISLQDSPYDPPVEILDNEGIGKEVITSEEEYSERFINDVFNEYGIEAEQSGAGDSMTVKAVDKDGNVTAETTIDLDIARTDLDLDIKPITGGGEGDLGIQILDPEEQRKKIEEEREKLKNFIKENARPKEAEKEKDVRISDPDELNAARRERNELLQELQELKDATEDKIIDLAQEIDELFDVILDEESTFEEVEKAKEEYTIAKIELSELRIDFEAKLRVIDELNDIIIDSETEAYKNIKEYGVAEGDLDYDVLSYCWDVFLNAYKESLFGTFMIPLEAIRLPFGGLNKEDREFLRKDFDALFRGVEGDITELEKAKANYESGFLQKLGVVFLELLGNVAAALTLGGRAGGGAKSIGSILMKLLPVESAAMVYERTAKRMDEDPVFDDIPEWQKTLLKDSIAVVIYLLERLGLKLSVGQLNRVLVRLIEEYATKVKGKMTTGGFVKYIIDQLSNPSKIVKYVEKSAIAAVSEGGTEGSQGLGQKALQDLFNLTQDEDVFKPSEVIIGNEDLISQTGEEVALGAAAGAILGPLAPGDINNLTNEDISRSIITLDPNSNENLIANLKKNIALGKITAKDAQAIIDFNKQVQEIAKKYIQLPDITKEELFELIKKDALLQDLQQQFNEGGIVAQKILGPRIDKLKAEMDAIADNAVKRSETKVQPEEEITDEQETEEVEEVEEVEQTPEENIIEAKKIASFAISRDNNLTLEELGQVSELIPDLDIDISTDRDIKADELLTKINDYAVQRETTDSVQDTGEEGQGSGTTSEMEVPQQQEEVQDEKQVDEDKPEDEGPDEPQIEVAGVTLDDIKRILGEDPSTEDVFFEGESLKNKITKIKRHVFSRRKFLPKVWSDLVDQRDNQQAADLYRAEKLLARYKSELKKLPKDQQNAIDKIGGLYLSGGLPKSFLDGEMSRDEAITEVENAIADLNSQLESSTDPSEQRKLKEEINKGYEFLFFLSEIDNSLSEEGGGSIIPDNVLDIIKEMRDMIDNFSQTLISDPDVKIDDNKAQTIEDNLGEYVNRSYQVYNDPNWKKKVSEEVKENAEQFLFDQYMKSFEQQQDILGIGPEGGTFTDPITGEEVTVEAENKQDLENKLRKRAKNKVISILSKEGATQVLTITDSKGILKERKDIPIEIRMLMGEYGDTGSKFITTVAKQSTVLRNEQMKSSFIKTGIENGFVFKTEEEALDNSEGDQQYNAKITIGDKTFYTAPSVKKAFDYMEEQSKKDPLIKLWLKAASIVKWGKTIGSPATQSVNFLSNTGFAAINGHIIGGEEARKTTGAELLSWWTDPNNRTEQQEAYARYLELGIINQNIALNDIKEFAKKGEDQWVDDQLKHNSSFDQARKWAGKGLEKLYEAGDNFWKIRGFEIEKNRYAEALYGKPFEELNENEKKYIEETAAEIIKDVYPNYAKLPEFINEIRRTGVGPIVSSFVAFQYESYRTMIKTFALAKKEMNNPKLTGIAGRRIAGALSYYTAKQTVLGFLASSAGFAIGGLAGTITGVDDEESKELSKLRDRFLPSYSQGKGSSLFTIKNEDGTYSYIDLSQMDPHQNAEKIMTAITQSDDPADAFINVLNQGLITPFASGDIVAQLVVDLSNNEKPNGAPIYNPEDDISQIFDDILEYGGKKLYPGIVSTIQKINKDSGKGALSFFGARPYDIDVPRTYRGKILKLKYDNEMFLIKDGVNDAIKDFAKDQDLDLEFLIQDIEQPQVPLTDQGEPIEVKQSVLTKAIFGGLTINEYYKKQNEKYKNFINEAHLDYKAAVEVFGMDEMELQKVMEDQKIPNDIIKQIVHNQPKDIETKYAKIIKEAEIESLKSQINKLKEQEERLGDAVSPNIVNKRKKLEKSLLISQGKNQKEKLKEILSNKNKYKINESDSQEEKNRKRKELNEEAERLMKDVGYSEKGLYPKIKQFDNVVDMLLQE